MFGRGLRGPGPSAVLGGRGQDSGLQSRSFVAPLALLLALFAITPAVAQAARPPVLVAREGTLKWTASGKHRLYRLSVRIPGTKATSTMIAARSVTPPAAPGATVIYQVKAAYNESAWSNRVSIAYPEPKEEPKEEPPEEPEPPTEPPVEPPPPEGGEPPGTPGEMIVALNAGGWGPGAFADITGAAKSVRLESRFATDSEVGGAAAAGVSVGTWVFGTGGTIGAIDPASYAAGIVAAFKRYGKGGTFWSGRPDLGGRAVEVLNEPGNKYFWGDPANYVAYVNLLRVVHEALAANFPAAIRPQLLASWDGGEGPSSPWGPGWMALGGLPYVDGVTVHPYGGSSGQDGGALGGHLDVEGAHILSGKPVYITEVGWPTAVGQPSTGDSQQWSEEQQAENIKNFVAWARATDYVEMVVIFNYVDYGTNNWYGIEHKDRTHKLSFAALGEA
jgi:hypothetical protein